MFVALWWLPNQSASCRRSGFSSFLPTTVPCILIELSSFWTSFYWRCETNTNLKTLKLLRSYFSEPAGRLGLKGFFFSFLLWSFCGFHFQGWNMKNDMTWKFNVKIIWFPDFICFIHTIRFHILEWRMTCRVSSTLRNFTHFLEFKVHKLMLHHSSHSAPPSTHTHTLLPAEIRYRAHAGFGFGWLHNWKF